MHSASTTVLEAVRRHIGEWDKKYSSNEHVLNRQITLKILECGGNLFDAVSLAVKAAMFNTRVPKVQAALMDGGTVDLTLSDDPYDCDRLKIESVPLLVTICKIGEHCVVDPSAEEEVCSSASLVVGVSNQNGKCKKNVQTV